MCLTLASGCVAATLYAQAHYDQYQQPDLPAMPSEGAVQLKSAGMSVQSDRAGTKERLPIPVSDEGYELPDEPASLTTHVHTPDAAGGRAEKGPKRGRQGSVYLGFATGATDVDDDANTPGSVGRDATISKDGFIVPFQANVRPPPVSDEGYDMPMEPVSPTIPTASSFAKPGESASSAIVGQEAGHKRAGKGLRRDKQGSVYLGFAIDNANDGGISTPASASKTSLTAASKPTGRRGKTLVRGKQGSIYLGFDTGSTDTDNDTVAPNDGIDTANGLARAVDASAATSATASATCAYSSPRGNCRRVCVTDSTFCLAHCCPHCDKGKRSNAEHCGECASAHTQLVVWAPETQACVNGEAVGSSTLLAHVPVSVPVTTLVDSLVRVPMALNHSSTRGLP